MFYREISKESKISRTTKSNYCGKRASYLAPALAPPILLKRFGLTWASDVSSSDLM